MRSMDPKTAPYSQNSDLKSENIFEKEEQFEEDEEEDEVRELIEEAEVVVDEKERSRSGLKKAAVAGAAVAAAPAVLPPALALSAVGIALSLPFAACLAALACTHRLIRSFLPSSPSSYYYNNNNNNGDHSSGPSIEHHGFGFDPYSSDEENELLYSEEVIWHQIDALRTIVGYSDTLIMCRRTPSSSRLLRRGATYLSERLFQSDLRRRDNLRFLKFFVGVK